MLSRLSSFSGPLSKLFTAIKGFTLQGLILRYDLKNSDVYSGTSNVTDLVGNSNGTLYNGVTYSINGYFNLDGINDYVITNNSLNLVLSPPNTSDIISHFIWVYPMDNGVIVTEQGTSSLNTSWHDSQIEIVSGNLKFAVWTGLGSTSFVSSISTPLYNWYYVGLTYDGSTLRGYINSQLAGSIVVSRSSPYYGGAGLYYGLGATDFTNLGDGTYAKMKLGDFHVYNTALSQQQILNNYNITKSNYIYSEDMLIWLDANDPQSFSGGSIFDLSGNNYTHSLSSTSSTVYGFRSFDCTAASNNYIKVNATGPTLSTSGYTYVAWGRIKSDSSTWRTLYRSAPNDHAILVEINTDNLGFYDNDTNSFRDSGYDVTLIEEKWVQYSVVGDSSSSIFYINDVLVGSVSYGAGGNKHDYFGAIDGQPFGYVSNMILYNKKLSQVEIKQNYDALKHVYANGNFVINNLILHFNPASYLSYPGSGTSITNLATNSLNGTLSNISFAKPYLTFNGSNSQVTITDSALLEPGSGDWTMEVWININVIQSSVILGKFDGGGASIDVCYSIRLNGAGTLFAQIGSGSGSGSSLFINSTSYLPNLNTWYQVVYVFKNVSENSLETYINGVSIGSVSHSLPSILNTSNNLYLGSYNNGEYSQYFNGKIGITRIYNSALSASDVSKNFEANRKIYDI